MIRKGGLAVFFEQDTVTAAEVAEFSYAGYASIVVRGCVGAGTEQNTAASLLKKDGIQVVFAGNIADGFDKICRESGLEMVTLKEQDIDELFHTFGEKDTELFIIDTDEGTRKVKAVSGSLSKSWLLEK